MPANLLRTSLLALAIAAASGAATPPRPVHPASMISSPVSPADLYGALFEAVQTERVFPDSKTFVDMVPRVPPERIMADYAREKPQGREALAAFVADHFAPAGESARPTMREHIRGLWPLLGKPPIAQPEGSSALTLPAAFVVPGGRYQEFY